MKLSPKTIELKEITKVRDECWDTTNSTSTYPSKTIKKR